MSETARRKLGTRISISALISIVGEPILDMVGSPDTEIDSVAPLTDGGPDTLVFCIFGGQKGIKLISQNNAAAIVVGKNFPLSDAPDRCILKVSDPARWFVRAISHLVPEENDGLARSAAHIEDGARVGNGCRIGAGTFISSHVNLGHNCIIGPNCAIGGPGLAVVRDESGIPLRFPHLGDVVIGNNVAIGANSVIVRGILETTRVGDHCQIGNLVNVGHNCTVGTNCWISTGVTLCGSVTIGERVMIGAGATVNNKVIVGDDATVGIGSVVTKSVPNGRRVFGVPAKSLVTMQPL